jgi:hypothetical protein
MVKLAENSSRVIQIIAEQGGLIENSTAAEVGKLLYRGREGRHNSQHCMTMAGGRALAILARKELLSIKPNDDFTYTYALTNTGREYLQTQEANHGR